MILTSSIWATFVIESVATVLFVEKGRKPAPIGLEHSQFDRFLQHRTACPIKNLYYCITVTWMDTGLLVSHGGSEVRFEHNLSRSGHSSHADT